jgi:hypothetical protein
MTNGSRAFASTPRNVIVRAVAWAEPGIRDKASYNIISIASDLPASIISGLANWYTA